MKLGPLVVLAVVGACASPSTPEVDGGAQDGGAGALVTPPNIPWLDDGRPAVALPELGPCRPGWSVDDTGSVSVCDPLPEPAAACPDGQARFAGTAGCESVGAPCPSGPFADGLPTTGDLYFVDPSAPAGGDGTRTAPYDLLSRVPWTSLGAGAVVALGKGSIVGSLPLNPGVRVVGACAAETRLSGVAAPIASVVSVSRAGEAASVENLSIVDAPQVGARVTAGQRLTMSGVVVQGAMAAGVVASAEGSALTLTEVVVRSTRTRADGSQGRGINIEAGSTLEATRVVSEDNRVYGLYIEDSEVSLTDVVIRGTRQRDPSEGPTAGIQLANGAQLTASGLLSEGNRLCGIRIAGSDASLEDTIVRGTLPLEGFGSGGRGIEVVEGSLRLRRGIVDGSQEAAIIGTTGGARIEVEDVLIRGTLARSSDLKGGYGIDVEDDAVLVANRVWLEDNSGAGIFAGVFADTIGADVTLTDITVHLTEAVQRVPSGGSGIVVDQSTLVASRIIVDGHLAEGIFIGASLATVEDVLLRGGSTGTGPRFGIRGVAIQDGADATLSRFLIEGGRYSGLLASEAGTSARLTDALIRDIRSRSLDGRGGDGVVAQLGAEVTGARVRVERVRSTGLASVSGSRMVFEDISVLSVGRASCAESSCPDHGFGYGAAAIAAQLTLSRFEVSGAGTCGVFVSAGAGPDGAAELDLSDGVVRESILGACIQSDGYDLSRLQSDVAYVDNESSLQVTTLPVPMAVEPSLARPE